MPRILLTAFEPYDQWSENSSWAALIELTRWLGHRPQIVTRRYPVDVARMTERLEHDLSLGFDYALHLGQAPGSTEIRLEAVGLNLTTDGSWLCAGAPIAYRTPLPLGTWVGALRTRGIPASVSYHAGTHLCNALFYLSQHWCATRSIPTRSAFLHVPLAPQQIGDRHPALASMSTAMVAAGIGAIVEQLDRGELV